MFICSQIWDGDPPSIIIFRGVKRHSPPTPPVFSLLYTHCSSQSFVVTTDSITCENRSFHAALGGGAAPSPQKGRYGKDSFKGMPSWKGKGKGDGKSKGGKQQGFPQQPPQANVAQQSSSSTTPAQEKQETTHAEESWSWDDTYWTGDWSWDTYTYYGGYEGDYSQGDWYNWSYFVSSTELTLTEDKHSEDQQNHSVDGQTDQIGRLCFFCHLLVPFSRTWTHAFCHMHKLVHFSVVPVLLQFEQIPHSEHSQFWSKCCNRFR